MPATVSIEKNDSAPSLSTVTVTASHANASEIVDTGASTTTRTAGSLPDALPIYSLNGSASNGSDYQQLGNSVTIAAGSSSAIVTVTPIDDSSVEGAETVVLTLSANSTYTVGSPNSATVTIADNDSAPSPPTVTVTASDANASESGDTGAFTITR